MRIWPKPATLEAWSEAFYEAIQSLTPGIWQLTLHLNGDRDEVKAITPDWENRFREFTFFTSDEAKKNPR